MAGGTSRKDHSEVGSSYIHFNFTPDGDKTTRVAVRRRAPRRHARPAADLPRRPGRRGRTGARGLRHRGGRGLGPARRRPRGRQAHHRGAAPGLRARRRPARLQEPDARGRATTSSTWRTWSRSSSGTSTCGSRSSPRRSWGAWSTRAPWRCWRWPKEERTKRLTAMVAKVPAGRRRPGQELQRARRTRSARSSATSRRPPAGTRFLAAFQAATGGAASDYMQTIQRLPPTCRALGVEWLQQIVDALCAQAAELLLLAFA